MMTSECLLGLHLRELGVRWRADPRFNYMFRRVPGDPNMSNPYTRMLATHKHSEVPELRRYYEQRERAVETHAWGDDLRLPNNPPAT